MMKLTCLSLSGLILKKLLHTGNSLKVLLSDSVKLLYLSVMALDPESTGLDSPMDLESFLQRCLSSLSFAGRSFMHSFISPVLSFFLFVFVIVDPP